MPRNTQHLAWVVTHMPKESDDALAKFTKSNPRWQGAHWDDVLDVILDADGHLELTEPMFDMMQGTDFPPNLVSAVSITLLWASKAFADLPLEHKAMTVRATIDNNGDKYWRATAETISREDAIHTCEGIEEAMLLNLNAGAGADTMMLTHAVRDLTRIVREHLQAGATS